MMTIFYKPGAGLIVEHNVIYMLNTQSQGRKEWYGDINSAVSILLIS